MVRWVIAGLLSTVVLAGCNRCKSGCREDGQCKERCGDAAAAPSAVAASGCEVGASCATEGACGSVRSTDGKVEAWGSKGVETTKGTFTCAPTKPEHCAKAEVCRRRGACTLKNNKCVPGTDAECRASEDCDRRGLCHAVADSPVCVPSGDSDCAASKDCAYRGHCVAMKGERGAFEICGPKTPEVCKGSTACKREGFCSLVTTGRGTRICAPKSAADCKDAEVCRADGRCRLLWNECQK